VWELGVLCRFLSAALCLLVSHCPSLLLTGFPLLFVFLFSVCHPWAAVPQGCPCLSLARPWLSGVSPPECGSPAGHGVQKRTPYTMTLFQLCFQTFPAPDGFFLTPTCARARQPCCCSAGASQVAQTGVGAGWNWAVHGPLLHRLPLQPSPAYT